MSALTEDDRSRIRWHFAAHAENPEGGYASVGIANIERMIERILTTRLAEADARIDSLTIAVKAMVKRADDAEAALEAGDACGAVGCRALGERDRLHSEIEARIAIHNEAARTAANLENWSAKDRHNAIRDELRSLLDGDQP